MTLKLLTQKILQLQNMHNNGFGLEGVVNSIALLYFADLYTPGMYMIL